MLLYDRPFKSDLLFNTYELNKIKDCFNNYIREVEILIKEIKTINSTDRIESDKILVLGKIDSKIKVIENLLVPSSMNSFLHLYRNLLTNIILIDNDLNNLGISKSKFNYFNFASYLPNERIILHTISNNVKAQLDHLLIKFQNESLYLQTKKTSLNVRIEKEKQRQRQRQRRKISSFKNLNLYRKNLKLKEITIKGWRSFDNEKGITLKDLKNINILIGANNVGKSNLFKYFYHWSLIFPVHDLKSEWDKFYLKNQFKKEDRWLEDNINVSSKFLIEEINSLGSTTFKSKYQYLKYASNKSGKNFFNSSLLSPSDRLHFHSYEKKHVIKSWHKLINTIEYIGPMRDFEGETKGSPRGELIDSFLDNIKTISSNQTLFNNFKIHMNRWLSKIFMEKTEIQNFSLDSTFQILHGRRTQSPRIIISQKRNGRMLHTNLSNMGTGIAQVINILTHLYMRKFYEQSSLIVFLEEPESNLHPRALTNFIQLLDSEFEEFQFFISTHSNALLNQIEKDWKVFNITKLEDKGAIAKECLRRTESYEILDELGVLPSNLLLSNFVIWVEGPSDRIYIKKWIELFSDNKLKENFHYCFEIYGGSNFKNFSVENKNNKEDIAFSNSLIDLMKSSRYNAIICDSDNDLVKKTRNKKAYLLKRKIERDKELKNFCFVWITHGRDIENYIPDNILRNALPKRQSVDGKSIVFKPTKEIKMHDEFEEFYSKMFVYTNSGKPVKKESYLGLIQKGYSQNKVNIANRVTKQWDNKSDYSKDLETKILFLISKIREANFLN